MPTATSSQKPIAYFSMEVGLNPAVPTYSGGLGVLAGDTLKAAADLRVPMVGITLFHRKGYFRQELDAKGQQHEHPYEWDPADHMELVPQRVTVEIEGRKVRLAAWRYDIKGVTGHTVPVYFLDVALEDNAPEDIPLTERLYGGDNRYRLCQEVILGMGGVALLRALGHAELQAYHMNEGHSALLTLALTLEEIGKPGASDEPSKHREAIRKQCIVPPHLPVPAGHDQFDLGLVRRVLGDDRTDLLERAGCILDGTLNMTYVGLTMSRYVNGVAMRHGEVSQDMFPNFPVNSITNGVHAGTWVCPAFQKLFDHHIPEWRFDNNYLRYAVGIRREEIRAAHDEAKAHLISEVKSRSGQELDPRAVTLGFARRATAYKRAELLFTDIERLKWISSNLGRVQIVFGGKAHPHDDPGKAIIRRIFEARDALKEYVDVVYLAEYDMTLGGVLTSGVDVWMNTPLKPHEASGTSGMKAALNGVPSFSVLDGWWIEGHVEGVTGWSIGEQWYRDSDDRVEAASLYHKLESQIIPLFYRAPDAWAQVMRSCISLNGSFFNTQRMMIQYLKNAYGVSIGPHALEG